MQLIAFIPESLRYALLLLLLATAIALSFTLFLLLSVPFVIYTTPLLTKQ